MDHATAQLVLGSDSSTNADALRQRFEERRDRLERQIVEASGPAQKDDLRRQLAALHEAYAALSGSGTAAAAPVPTPSPSTLPAEPVAAAPATRRGLAIASLLIVVATAAIGIWQWQHHVAAQNERERVLSALRALPDDAGQERIAACEAEVRIAAAGAAAAYRGELEAALALRVAAITGNCNRLDAALTREIGEVATQVDRIATEAAEAHARLAAIPAPETASGERREYLRLRRETWSAFLAWLEPHAADLPARRQLEAARAATAVHQRTAAHEALAAATAALAQWPAARDTARKQRFEVPWLDANVARFAAGAGEWPGWYRTDEGTATALVLLGERLAVLDRIAAVPPETAAQAAMFAALAPQDARLGAWRSKLGAVQDHLQRLAALDDETTAAAHWREYEAPLAELVALVGSADDPVARWAHDQAGRRTRFDAARTALAALDTGTSPSAEACAALDLALEDLAKLVPDDDADLARWRGKLDPLAGASRFRRAMATTDIAKHEALLVAAARGGNADAGARMVWLGMWGEMGTIDPRQGLVAAWADGHASHAGITEAQIYGEFLANWATRHRKLEELDVNAEMLRGRELITSAPLSNPVLLSEAGWLWKDVTPDDEDKAKELRSGSAGTAAETATACASDPLRALRILTTGAGAASEVEDMPQYRVLEGKAVQVAEAAGWFDLACYHAVALARSAETDQAEALFAKAVQRCLAAAATYHRANDPAHEAYCLSEAAYAQRPDNRSAGGSWDAARECYERAVAAYVLAGKPADQGEMVNSQAWCLRPDNNPGGSWARADALYTQAAAIFRRAARPLQVAGSLALRALCNRPSNNPDGNWDTAAGLLGEAANAAREGGVRLTEAGYLKQQAECLDAACSKGKLDRWITAAERYGAAATLYESLTELDLASYCLHQQAYFLDPTNNPHGDRKDVTTIYRKALEIGQRGERAPEELAITWSNLGWNLRPDSTKPGKDASWSDAAEAFAKSAELFATAEKPDKQGESLYHQAQCLYPENNAASTYPRCLEVVKEAVALLRDQAGMAKLLGYALQVKGNCERPDHDPAGSWATAIGSFEEASRVLADAGDQLTTALCLSLQARGTMPCNNGAGSWSDAEALYARAATIYAAEKNPLGEAHCLHQQAVCMVQNSGSNMNDRARELFRRSAGISRANNDEEQAKVSEEWIK